MESEVLQLEIEAGLCTSSEEFLAKVADFLKVEITGKRRVRVKAVCRQMEEHVEKQESEPDRISFLQEVKLILNDVRTKGEKDGGKSEIPSITDPSVPTFLKTSALRRQLKIGLIIRELDQKNTFTLLL